VVEKKSEKSIRVVVVNEWCVAQGAAVSLGFTMLGNRELALVGLSFGGILSIDLRKFCQDPKNIL
jgi:hypothetical protein